MRLLVKARKPAPGQLSMFGAGGQPTVKPRPAAGWQPIPGGKHGGQRRRKGSGWEYRYPKPGGGWSSSPVVQEPVKPKPEPKPEPKPKPGLDPSNMRGRYNAAVFIQATLRLLASDRPEDKRLGRERLPQAKRLGGLMNEDYRALGSDERVSELEAQVKAAEAPEPKVAQPPVAPVPEPPKPKPAEPEPEEEKKYETTGYVFGSRAELHQLRMGGELEKDPAVARKLVTRENVLGGKVKPESFAPERAAGVTAGAAYLKYQLLKNIQERPDDSPEARDKYTETIFELQQGLAGCKTLSDVRTLQQEWIDAATGNVGGTTLTPEQLKEKGWDVLFVDRKEDPTYLVGKEATALWGLEQEELAAEWAKERAELERQGRGTSRSKYFREAQEAYRRRQQTAQSAIYRELHEKYKVKEFHEARRRATEEIRKEFGTYNVRQLPGGKVQMIGRSSDADRAEAVKRFEVLGSRFTSLFGRKLVERYGGTRLGHPRERSKLEWQVRNTAAELEALHVHGQTPEQEGHAEAAEKAWAWLGGAKAPKGSGVERKKKPDYQTILHEARLGPVSRKGPDIPGNDGISAQGMKDDLKLREVEYGNWASESERQWHTEAAHAALVDLATVLGVSKEKVSIGGRLTIGLGSRGKGNARAHYEPATRVINITKMSGKGSLAHEWGHFLDHMIHMTAEPGKGAAIHPTDQAAMGRVMSSNIPQATQTAIKGVMSAIMREPQVSQSELRNAIGEKRREASRAQREARGEAQKEHDRLFEEWKKEHPDKMVPEGARWQNAEYRRLREVAQELPHIKAKTEAAEALADEVNAMVKDFNRQLRRHGSARKSTEFYEASQIMGDYWARPHEMFARCFEAFIHDEMKEKGMGNTYLVKGVDAMPDFPGYFPKGEHRQRITAAMRELVKALHQDRQFEKALRVAWSGWLDSLMKGPRLTVPSGLS